MRIIGIKIDKISAERFKEPEGNINLKTNFNLGKAIKEDIDVPEKDPVFSFDFTYTLDFEDTAKIEYSGKIFTTINKKISKDVEKNTKDIPNELRSMILDFVLHRTHVESLHLEERLGLPFHISSPKTQIKSKENSNKDLKEDLN